MQLSAPPSHHNLESGEEAGRRFSKSLQELKDLRSQLHQAADHCEAAFLNATQKKKVVESTKDYIRDAILTVIDHLGNVSDNLESEIRWSADVSHTNLRIDCLKQVGSQRLLTCQQYSLSLDLSALRWSGRFPRHLPRYSKQPQSNGWDEVLRDVATKSNVSKSLTKHEEKRTDSALPNIGAATDVRPLQQPHQSSGMELSAVLPVLKGSRFEDAHNISGWKIPKKKPVQGSSYFLSFLRRRKRST